MTEPQRTHRTCPLCKGAGSVYGEEETDAENAKWLLGQLEKVIADHGTRLHSLTIDVESTVRDLAHMRQAIALREEKANAGGN